MEAMTVERKIKSFADLGAIKGACLTDAKAETLLLFIADYQAKHNGDTPSYSAMENQLQVPEAAVLQLLGRLENRGKIHFISRRPPKIMVIGKDTVLPHEQGDDGAPREGAFGRFLDAEAARMGLARFIAEKERREEHISLRDMADYVGIDNLSYVSRMADILRDRGLIQYGPRLRTRLTARGREFFGLDGNGANQQQRERVIVIDRSERSRNPTSVKSKVDPFCQMLAERMRQSKTDVCKDNYDTFTSALGYSQNSTIMITKIATEAMRRGLLMPKLPYTKGLKFTEKGLGKYLPEQSSTPVVKRKRAPKPHKAEITAEAGPAPTALLMSTERPIYKSATEASGATETGPLDAIPTALLVMELVERGYTVRKN